MSAAEGAVALDRASHPRELIRGDPDEVRAVAATWRAQGESLAEAAARHGAVDLRGEWAGAAADAFHAALAAHCERLRYAAETSGAAAEALTRFAHELDEGHRLARRAMAFWEGAGPVVAVAGLRRGFMDAGFWDPADELRRSALRLLDRAQEEVNAAEEVAVRRLEALLGRVPADSVFAADPVHTAAFAAILPDAPVPPLLTTLEGLSAGELERYVRTHPDLLPSLLALGPATIARWWRRLSAEAVARLSAGLPRVVGNLDGVPPGVRSTVNARQLETDLSRTLASLSDARLALSAHPADPALQVRAQQLAAHLETLRRIRRAYGAGPAGAPAHELYAYSTEGKVKVALSTGLIETAEHVTLLVPGMGTTADDVGRYGEASWQLLKRQARVADADPSRLAVVAWLDYDPPGPTDVWGVSHDELARAGALRLGHTVQGIDQISGGGRGAPAVSVVAHSYGTAVATLALAQGAVAADNVVLLGSAGIPSGVRSATALHVPPGQVFASEGVNDEWAGWGRLLSGRADPTGDAFGAHVFTSEDATIDGEHLHGITEHGPLVNSDSRPDRFSYLDPRTSAQYATAKATMGFGAGLPESGDADDRIRAHLLEELSR
ncbi:alpha/beta hydrolase [Leifsonia sp. F6_8S_P_1B]|uniref:Alpha/beta hydrolase n=1 Tax=Leifsonia williamsii TaxID=3035919 RepID=A0ABT8KCQ9_9MICO|nr:alpha/beta hydrolase [Leifsonia williamsii]MDN4614758.1 alpha/beta hydrolase [Leifsonia williamsii]